MSWKTKHANNRLQSISLRRTAAKRLQKWPRDQRVSGSDSWTAWQGKCLGHNYFSNLSKVRKCSVIAVDLQLRAVADCGYRVAAQTLQINVTVSLHLQPHLNCLSLIIRLYPLHTVSLTTELIKNKYTANCNLSHSVCLKYILQGATYCY